MRAERSSQYVSLIILGIIFFLFASAPLAFVNGQEVDLRFHRLTIEDGLLGNEFWGGSYYKSKSGEMFFGTVNGFNRFYPRQIKDEKLKKMFSESQTRIQSMSLIHESLYKSGDLSQINFSEYIKNLTNILISSYGIDKEQVRLVQDIGDVFLDTHRSIPLGLIINELISNSLKHAFPDNRSGEIFIHMHTDSEGLHVLEIRDTGVGFPDNIDYRRTISLGMQLVTGLVQQIQGTIKLVRDKGTAWVIVFPSGA